MGIRVVGSYKGYPRLTLAKELRELGVKPGDIVMISVEGDAVVIRKVVVTYEGRGEEEGISGDSSERA